MKTICFLCGGEAESNFSKNPVETHSMDTEINCPICGHFQYTHEFARDQVKNNELQIYKNKKENDKAKIALRNYFKTHDFNTEDILSTENVETIINKVDYPESLLDKIDKVLEYFYNKSDFFQQEIYINLQDFALFFCLNQLELLNILDDLNKKEFIFTSNNISNIREKLNESGSLYIRYKDSIPARVYHHIPIRIKLLSNGIKKIEESKDKSNSNQCFVAMWFDKSTKKLWKEIKSLEKETGFNFYKVDINKDKNNGWIPDTIIKEIRRSRFMIADLTGYRAGVYYEAGFAEGLGKEVIYTCNKDWFDEDKEEMKIPIKCQSCESENDLKLDSVHFNLKQRKMIHWEENKLNEFKKRLKEKIGALIPQE